MQRPHLYIFCKLTLSLAVFSSFAATVGAQSPSVASEDRDRGIQLYKLDDSKRAIESLSAAVKKNKDDADSWYYLGLARALDDDQKKARKAFETTVRLRPNFAAAHAALSNSLLFTNQRAQAEVEAQRTLTLEPENAEGHYLLGMIRLTQSSCIEAMEQSNAALKSAPSFGLAYLLRSQSRLCDYATTSLKPFKFGGGVFKTGSTSKELSPEEKLANSRRAAQEFKEAADDLEKFLQLAPHAEDVAIWRKQVEILRVHAEPAEKPEATRKILTGPEVTTKVRVLAKPEPTYTKAAREAQIIGTVVLRAVFAADGTVQNILVVNSLPKGLTQQAITAAQRIKFIPATKDGYPVSVFMQLEYNFNLY